MAVSSYGAREEDKNKKLFWLEFQVCSDGHYVASSGGQQQQTPATFTCFGRLPPELRLKVWEMALQPRVVIAACLDEARAPAKRAQLARRPRCPPAPALLHVSREARQLALRRYEPALAWRVPPAVAARPPRASGARVWFDFARDTLLLLGELEPCDPSGGSAPMVCWLRPEDTRRVRHVACAFEALHLGDVAGEQVFGRLFHVLDRFPGAARLLITSTEEDLERHTMIGCLPSSTDNVVQKIWWGWINGTSVVTSTMRDKQILMVREDALAEFVAEHT